MTSRTTSIWIAVALVASATAWAQPPDFAVFPGDDARHQHRGQDDRLARMADYLDLSDAQTIEWQAIVDRHREAAQGHWDQVAGLREDFRQLADQEDPNLEQLGRIALEMHRDMESRRSSRERMITDLEGMLTPEQMDKFDALQAARDFTHPRGRRGHRPRRQPADGD